MIQEIDADVAGRGLYVSNYLSPAGATQWPTLLREAARSGTDRSGTDDTLAGQLSINRCFKAQVERRKPKGGTTWVAVPNTAPMTLAEGQFNTYYMRAFAIRAIAAGAGLLVYRAKAVDAPRTNSEQMIGTVLDPQTVLDALRATLGVEPVIGIPLPNSGLCVRLR